MLDKITKFADRYDMFPSSGVVLACVSGGADSMCLLDALLEIEPSRGFDVSVAHFNHMLRDDEALRDEEFVREYCAGRGVGFYSGSGDVRAYAVENKLGIEEAAREMRYSYFCEAAAKAGATQIATAHTMDDNAETIIMNLARGAGASGLSGIPPVRDASRPFPTPYSLFPTPLGAKRLIIRPMLCVSRDDVLLFAERRGVPFVEDSTNSLDIYTRNKVRHAIMPLLKEINPRFNEAAAATAELSRADEEYLSRTAEEFIRTQTRDGRVECAALSQLTLAISRRVVRMLYGGNLSFDHVQAVLELCRRTGPPASLSLPGMTVFREYGQLVFCSEGKERADGFAPVYPTKEDSIIIPELGLKMSCKTITYSDIMANCANTDCFLFKSIDICGKMTVRPRREGDCIRLRGQNGTKTLKKLFIERRIPSRERSSIPVVADDKGVLAVYGIGAGDRAVPELGDTAVQLEFATQGDD